MRTPTQRFARRGRWWNMSSHPVHLGGTTRSSATIGHAGVPPTRAHRPEAAAFAPLLHRAAPRSPASATGAGKAPPRGPRDGSVDDTSRRGHHAPDAALRSEARQASQIAPPPRVPPTPVQPAAAATVGAEVRVRASIEDLLPALVRKVAWCGDARSGSVLLELGAGALAGARLLVTAEGGRVHVQLSAPPGVDLAGWRTRITARLAARGLDVTGVDVGSE